MTFCARSAEDIGKEKIGNGQLITVDGMAFGPKMRAYVGVVDPDQPRLVDSKGRPFGAPTRAQLADPRLWIETLGGLPWPGSACDRFAKGKCADAMANALAGAKSPFGVWPDEREKVAQSNDRIMRERPVERMEAVLKTRSYSEPDKVRLRAHAQAVANGQDPDAIETGLQDIESMMPALVAADVPAEPTTRRQRAATG